MTDEQTDANETAQDEPQRLTAEQLAEATGDDLREHLRAAGLPVSGVNDELRERLAGFYAEHPLEAPEPPSTDGKGAQQILTEQMAYRVAYPFPVGRRMLQPGDKFLALPTHPRVLAGHAVLDTDQPQPTAEQQAALDEAAAQA